MESTQNTSETAPLCELGRPPAGTPPQPHPGAGVLTERSADRPRGIVGGTGERGRGQGHGAELWVASFVQSDPGCPLGFLGDPVRDGVPRSASVRGRGPESSEDGRPRAPIASRAGRVRVPVDSRPERPKVAPRTPPAGSRSLTVIIVAHFLLAASLTVRHGFGPPPPGAAPPAAPAHRGPAARPEGLKGRRTEVGPVRVGTGCREGPRAPSRGVEAAPTRDTRRGRPGAAGLGGGRDHCSGAGGIAAAGGLGVQLWVGAAGRRREQYVENRIARSPEVRRRGSWCHAPSPGLVAVGIPPPDLRTLVAPGRSLRTRRLLKRLPGSLDPSAGPTPLPSPTAAKLGRPRAAGTPEGNPPERPQPPPPGHWVLLRGYPAVGYSHGILPTCSR